LQARQFDSEARIARPVRIASAFFWRLKAAPWIKARPKVTEAAAEEFEPA